LKEAREGDETVTTDRSKAELERDIDDFMRNGEAVSVAASSPARRARPTKTKAKTKAKAKRSGARARPSKARSPKRRPRPARKVARGKAKRRQTRGRTKKPKIRRMTSKKKSKSNKSSKKTARTGKRSAPRARSSAARASTATVAAASNPLATVLDAVEKMPESARFGPEKVFIYPLWERVGKKIGMSLDQFKRWLIGQNRERGLDLARADLVGAMDPGLVQSSEINSLGSTFHFVLDRSRRGSWW
jgi:hypothetical protein